MALTFRPYAPGDELAIAGLDRLVFQRERGPEVWLWRYRDAPDGPGIVELAWDGDKLVGHYAVSPTTLLVDGREVRGWLSGDTMTHPDYRARGLFPALAERARAQMGPSFWYGFPNAQSHRTFVDKLGWRDIAQVPTLRRARPSPSALNPTGRSRRPSPPRTTWCRAPGGLGRRYSRQGTRRRWRVTGRRLPRHR